MAAAESLDSRSTLTDREADAVRNPTLVDDHGSSLSCAIHDHTPCAPDGTDRVRRPAATRDITRSREPANTVESSTHATTAVCVSRNG